MRRTSIVLLVMLVFWMASSSGNTSYQVPRFIPDGLAGGAFASWATFLDFADNACPSMPDPWVDPTAGFYYVNSGTGNDSGNTFGTPASPRQSIPDPIPAGSLVVVNGNYTNTHNGFGTSGVEAQGTAESWVCIVGVAAAVTSQWDIADSSYLIVDLDFSATITGPCQLQIMRSQRVVIRNSVITGTTAGGGVCAFESSGAVSFLAILNSHIYNVGDFELEEDVDIHGIKIGEGVFSAFILNNEIDHTGGDSIQIEGATSQYIFIGGNHMHHNRQTGVWFKRGADVIVASNYIHSMLNETEAGGVVGVGAQYDPQNYWIVGNRIENTKDGIRIASQDTPGSGTEVFVVGNLIVNGFTASGAITGCSHSAMTFWGGDVVLALFNTMSNWPQGYCEPSSHNFGERYVHQMLVNGIDVANGGWSFKIEGGTAAATVSASTVSGIVSSDPYRQYLEGVGGNPFIISAPHSSAGLRVASDVGLSPTFTLNAGSSAIDFNPTNITGYLAVYESLYGVNLLKDALGRDRYNGVADVGFSEYYASGLRPRIRGRMR